MVLHVSEEKVGIMDGVLRISGVILPCDSLLPSLSSFSFLFSYFSSFLSKKAQIP